MDRIEQIRNLFDTTGFGLEIGPSYNPVLPKAAGYNVETVDHSDADALRRHYGNNPTVDASRIEEVDYVSDGRSLTEQIGEVGKYDFIVASHVIEHSTDLVGFLRDCETLLKPQGVLVLAVPDMRFCFDKFRPVTSIGGVMQAREERRTRHSYASLFDHVAYFCEVNKASGWARINLEKASLKHDVTDAQRAIERFYRPEYSDNHGWQFTPSSFRMIVEDLYAMGEVRLREVSFEETDIFEFFVVMKVDGKGSSLSRQVLAERTYDELAEVSDAYRTLKGQLVDAQASLRSKETEVQRVQEQLTPYQEQQAVYESEMQALKEDRDAALERVSALVLSTSWKVTQPVRSIVDRFRSHKSRR